MHFCFFNNFFFFYWKYWFRWRLKQYLEQILNISRRYLWYFLFYRKIKLSKIWFLRKLIFFVKKPPRSALSSCAKIFINMNYVLRSVLQGQKSTCLHKSIFKSYLLQSCQAVYPDDNLSSYRTLVFLIQQRKSTIICWKMLQNYSWKGNGLHTRQN